MNTQASLSPSLQPPHGLSLPGTVWGLDPSTHRLSAGVLERRFQPIPAPPPTYKPGDVMEASATFGKEECVGVHWGTCSYSQAGSMERRLAAALGDLLRFFVKIRDAYGAPVAIYLEEPFGGSDKPGPGGKIIKPHPHSFYFVAVVRCALGHLFAEPEVQMIGPTSWKAKAIGTGHGFAKKPEIMEWAHAIGYTGQLEDEADALGVATAGAVILTSA